MEKANKFVSVPAEERSQLAARVNEEGLDAIAKKLDLGPHTVAIAIAGGRTRISTRRSIHRFLRGPVDDDAVQEHSLLVTFVGTIRSGELIAKAVQSVAEALGCTAKIET